MDDVARRGRRSPPPTRLRAEEDHQRRPALRRRDLRPRHVVAQRCYDLVMRRTYAFGLALVAIACSKSDSSAHASADSDAGADAAAPFVREPIWSATSKRIQFLSWSFFEGVTGYEKDGAALTPGQLTAIAAIRTAP